MSNAETTRVLLARHGQSEGNVNPSIYPKKGDSKISLTEPGWMQAYGTGQFLTPYYQEAGVTEWPMIHVSTHNRTEETLGGILKGMGDAFPGEPKLYPQPFLTEKFFGAASALEFADEKLSEEVIKTLKRLSKIVYANDPFQASHLFGESTKFTMMAGKMMIDTIRRDIAEGKREHLVVTHGAVIQAMLMSLMHARPQDKNKIGNPGNADVIEIIGTPKNWSITRIWDGENGVRVNENLRDKVKRFTVADLPPLPDFLQQKP